MSPSLSEVVRDRLTAWQLAQAAVALGLLWVVLDPSVAQFAVTVVSTLVLGATSVIREAYDLRESVTNVGFGVLALLSGGGMAAFDAAGGLGLPALFLLAGVWFLADGVQTLRHEGVTRDRPDGHDVYQQYVRRRVAETLEERARTRRELVDALDADADRIGAAVETLRDRGVVTRVGSELRVDRRDGGRLDSVRRTTTAAASRLARPLTLELGEGGGSGSRTTTTTDAPSRTPQSVDEERTGETNSGDIGSREDHERERA